MSDEQITPRSIDRKAFGLDEHSSVYREPNRLTPESVAAYLARYPEVAEMVQQRIYTGIPGVCRDPGHVHEEFTCPACGAEAAALDVERLARALDATEAEWRGCGSAAYMAGIVAREYAKLGEKG